MVGKRLSSELILLFSCSLITLLLVSTLLHFKYLFNPVTFSSSPFTSIRNNNQIKEKVTLFFLCVLKFP